MDIQKIKEVIAEKEKQYDFNDLVANYMDDEQLKTIENTGDLETYLQDINEGNQITDTQVIYYHNAIAYLAEHDASLNESIEIAEEMGYSLKQINSELLASLLQSRDNADDYQEFIKEVISELN